MSLNNRIYVTRGENAKVAILYGRETIHRLGNGIKPLDIKKKQKCNGNGSFFSTVMNSYDTIIDNVNNNLLLMHPKSKSKITVPK